jgi:hypothetical protein
VLVTGSAGRLGRAVSGELLARGHRVRGFDRVASPGLPEAVEGDLTRPADLARATAGVETLIHLAATPDEDDFLTKLLPNNIVGLYHALEQARLGGVSRVILASTLQLFRGHRGPFPITLETPTEPRNWYAAAKAFLEAAGHVYAHVHGLEVTSTWPMSRATRSETSSECWPVSLCRQRTSCRSMPAIDKPGSSPDAASSLRGTRSPSGWRSVRRRGRRARARPAPDGYVLTEPAVNPAT